MSPKVSIITPVFNAERYLRPALESVRQQTFRDFECICVDDGSTDGGARILDEYASEDRRFRVVRQPNRGTLVARKEAVRASAGDWCLFLDPDDWLEPDALKRLGAYIAEGGGEVISYGVDIHADAHNQNRVPVLDRQFNPQASVLTKDQAIERIFVKENLQAHLIGKIIRGDVCRRVFGRLTDIHVTFQEDVYVMYKLLAEMGGMRIVPDRLYHYRVGSGISYRQNLTLDELRSTLSRLELVDDLRRSLPPTGMDGSLERSAVDKIEVRMVRALISAAIERVTPAMDRKAAVALVKDSCRREVVCTALADWYSLKCTRFLNVAHELGLSEFAGDMALRQLDFVWRGHNSRLRDHDAALQAQSDLLDGMRKDILAQKRLLDEVRFDLDERKKALSESERKVSRIFRVLTHPWHFLFGGSA